MTVTAFDTLAYARKLKAAGIPEVQAEAQATALVEVLKESVSELATRADLSAIKADVNAVQVNVNNVRQEIRALEATLKQDMRTLEVTLKQDNRSVEAALKQDMTRLEAKFTTLEAKFGNLEERTEGRFRLLQWMLGFNLALTVAVLWLLIRQ